MGAASAVTVSLKRRILTDVGRYAVKHRILMIKV